MTFQPNEQGFRELEAAAAAAEDAWAAAIAERAREIAPVATGAYRDSIHVEREGADVAVVAGTDHALYVELGTADTPAFAPLTRATDESAHALPGIFAGAQR